MHQYVRYYTSITKKLKGHKIVWNGKYDCVDLHEWLINQDSLLGNQINVIIFHYERFRSISYLSKCNSLLFGTLVWDFLKLAHNFHWCGDCWKLILVTNKSNIEMTISQVDLRKLISLVNEKLMLEVNWIIWRVDLIKLDKDMSSLMSVVHGCKCMNVNTSMCGC